jgi:hypothetical protein
MATRAKQAAAAITGAAEILLTPRKIFGRGQAAGADLNIESTPPATGLTEPQARMSSDHNESTSAIMHQLQQNMQEEQQKGHAPAAAEHAAAYGRVARNLQNSVTQELQQELEALCNEMQQLRSEQSTLKAQVIVSITNMEKRDEQLQIKFKEQLRQQENALLLEMEKLRGNDEELQIQFDGQMQANENEQARLLQQSRELQQGMEELRGRNEELPRRQETDRLQGHDEQLQTQKNMIE